MSWESSRGGPWPPCGAGAARGPPRAGSRRRQRRAADLGPSAGPGPLRAMLPSAPAVQPAGGLRRVSGSACARRVRACVIYGGGISPSNPRAGYRPGTRRWGRVGRGGGAGGRRGVSRPCGRVARSGAGRQDSGPGRGWRGTGTGRQDAGPPPPASGSGRVHVSGCAEDRPLPHTHARTRTRTRTRTHQRVRGPRLPARRPGSSGRPGEWGNGNGEKKRAQRDGL